MKDLTVTTGTATTRFAGIDWASTDHAVCVVDGSGSVLERFTITHTRPALGRLTRRLRSLAVARVGIERPDGPVVQALLEAGLPIAVVPPDR